MKIEDSLKIAFAVVFLGGFLALWIYGRIRRHRAHSWPTIDGKVVSTEVKYEMTGMDPNTHIETKAG